jgi:hypothetical protein
VKHLTIEADNLPNKEGVVVPTAMLHCEPLVAQLPAPMPLPVPDHADAGHIAAMALYLTLGEDAEVTVTEEAVELLEPDLVGRAKGRGVYANSEGWGLGILVTSDDGSRTVEVLFESSQLLV